MIASSILCVLSTLLSCERDVTAQIMLYDQGTDIIGVGVFYTMLQAARPYRARGAGAWLRVGTQKYKKSRGSFKSARSAL